MSAVLTAILLGGAPPPIRTACDAESESVIAARLEEEIR